jgi:hypothetical protein
VADTFVPQEKASLAVDLLEACQCRQRWMKTICASDRKMLMAMLSRTDVTGYRSSEKRSLMIEIRRECNRI